MNQSNIDIYRDFLTSNLWGLKVKPCTCSCGQLELHNSPKSDCMVQNNHCESSKSCWGWSIFPLNNSVWATAESFLFWQQKMEECVLAALQWNAISFSLNKLHVEFFALILLHYLYGLLWTIYIDCVLSAMLIVTRLMVLSSSASLVTLAALLLFLGTCCRLLLHILWFVVLPATVWSSRTPVSAKTFEGYSSNRGWRHLHLKIRDSCHASFD